MTHSPIPSADGSHLEAAANFWRDAFNRQQKASEELLVSLERVISVIEAAGVRNLSNGVQLGQISWSIKMSDALEYARQTIAETTSVNKG